MNDAELLALHRQIVAVPSVSGEEAGLANLLEARLRAEGLEVDRVGDNLLAFLDGPPSAPLLAFDSHLDTVPPAPGWTRDPWTPAVEQGRVYGLGSNDAMGAVAAMVAAILRLRAEPAALRMALLLATEEETRNRGSEALRARLGERGLLPDAVIIGEPTGLDAAVSQDGLLVLELIARGVACHAAHRKALGGQNSIVQLAQDLLALASVDLGSTTLEPTVVQAGAARNQVPGEARAVLDLRLEGHVPSASLLADLRGAISGELVCLSDRLRPCSIDPNDPLVLALRDARPELQLTSSRGVSDWVVFRDLPAVKVGPGETRRSHTPDEYILEGEVQAGARFYEAAARAYALRHAPREVPSATLAG